MVSAVLCVGMALAVLPVLPVLQLKTIQTVLLTWEYSRARSVAGASRLVPDPELCGTCRKKERVRREFHATNAEANRAEKVAMEKCKKVDKLKKQLNRMNNRSADYSSDSSSCTKLE